MRNSAKRRLYGTLCITTTVGIIMCFSKVIPRGIVGEIHQVMSFVIIGAVLFLVAIPSAVAYQYYRAKPTDYDDLSAMKIGIEALGYVGKKERNNTRTDVADSGEDISKRTTN